MTAAIGFHFALGLALLIGGVWLLRRGRRVLGWMLSALGPPVTPPAPIPPSLHRYLHH